MPTINGRACVVDGTPVDKVFSNGKQVYGRNLVLNTASFEGWNIKGDNVSFVPSSTKGIKSSRTPSGWASPVATLEAKAGETYSISIRFWSDSKSVISAAIYMRKSPDVSSAATWMGSGNAENTAKTITISFKATEDETLYFTFENGTTISDGSFFTEQWKIEKNSSSTPWTPAPEDVM
ncbi:hypothetical protein ACI3P6_16435 [Lacticaseibacillus paracasei]|uniref:hypothetical protein n=1 Tax=Lacticaseibacillus paracasei TaxID=1597 RepID=UPI00091CCACB|nr:hypothetical protein [Lacticaseibacillus paracasei]GAV18156.1 hypothetical protein SILAB01_02049 [Lacticaseibacillus paracasei]